MVLCLRFLSPSGLLYCTSVCEIACCLWGDADNRMARMYDNAGLFLSGAGTNKSIILQWDGHGASETSA